jgi:HDOD domain-containing protein
MPLTLREIYKASFETVTAGRTASILLTRVAANDDVGDAYEEAIKIDRFFTTQTIEAASAALKKSVVKSLSHSTALFGKETIRNFVFGHTLLRIQNPAADQIFQELNKSKVVLKRAIEAEEISKKLSNQYGGLAFCAGYVFDLIEQRFIADTRYQKFQTFFDQTWRHCLRTACLTHAFTHHPTVLVKLNRLGFGGGLLHDVGKLLLLTAVPEKYEELIKQFEEAKASSPMDDVPQVEIEKKAFGLSHPEIGSFFCSHLGFVSELESVVDFHHDFGVLKTRDPDLYILAQFINVADRLAFYLETTAQPEVNNLTRLIEPHKPLFPLTAPEVQTLIVTLRSKAALP